MDLDHIDESLWTCKPSHLNGKGLDRLYKEITNLCCACAETCHNRNPNASLRRQISLGKCDSDNDSDNDGGGACDSDSDSDNDGGDACKRVDDSDNDGGGACKHVRLSRNCKDPRQVYGDFSQSSVDGLSDSD